MKKGKSFTYLGLVFSGHRNLETKEADAIFRTLHSIGISNYSNRATSSISVLYNHDDFYAAAKKAGAHNFDIYRCCGAYVVAGTNELFAINKEQALVFKSGYTKLLNSGKIEKEYNFFKDVKVVTWKRQYHKIVATSKEDAVEKIKILKPLDYEGREEYLSDFEEHINVGDVESGPTVEIIDPVSEQVI
jgi:hypothetical protein